MAFDPNTLNLRYDKAGPARPEVIAHQGKVLWKCRICYRYSPSNTHVCDNCGFKNPQTMGVR